MRPSSVRRTAHRGAPAAALALVAALTGCTASGPAPAPSTEPVPIHSSDAPVPGAEARTTASVDSCRIVARTSVERRLAGRVVRETVGVGPLGATTCTFVLSATNIGRSGIVSVSLDPHRSASSFARTRAAYPGARTVGGVGDHAFYVADLRLLQMIAGRSVVALRASLSAPATPDGRPALLRRDLVALAKDIALGR